MAAESPAELISSYRLKHGEVRVVRDATLDRIALEQARAMAAKDNLSHEVLGSFTRRIAPARAGRAAENIAYGYEVCNAQNDCRQSGRYSSGAILRRAVTNLMTCLLAEQDLCVPNYIRDYVAGG
jgi:hypothetical protein